VQTQPEPGSRLKKQPIKATYAYIVTLRDPTGKEPAFAVPNKSKSSKTTIFLDARRHIVGARQTQQLLGPQNDSCTTPINLIAPTRLSCRPSIL
jgi:hypothetical protein